MKTFFPSFRRKNNRVVGLLWVGPDAVWPAVFTSGAARSAKPEGKAVLALLGASDEPRARTWAGERGIETLRAVLPSDLIRALVARFVPEKSALVAGAIGETKFLGLVKDGDCIFEHATAGGIGEFEKALKASLRQARGNFPGYLVADSADSLEELRAVVQSALGGAPKVLASGTDAPLMLAAAVAPESADATPQYSLAATAAGITLLLTTLGLDYGVRSRVSELRARGDALESRRSALTAKAVALERSIDDPASMKSDAGSNIPEALELLSFLSQRLPEAVTVDEFRAADASSSDAGYAGIKISQASAVQPSYAVRGSARDLNAVSRLLQGFEGSAWRIQKVEQVEEAPCQGTPTDSAPAGFRFQLAISRGMLR